VTDPDCQLPEELQDAHDELKAAIAQPHGPDVDHVVDAMLALLAYVAGLSQSLQLQRESDRESILTDPEAIARRHGVNVGRLLNALEGAREGAGTPTVPLDNNEARFLLDLLTVVGFE
jgi:hypothetical protein